MLQAIINGQSVFRQEMQKNFDGLKKDLTERIDRVDKKLTGRIDNAEKNLTERIDNIGKALAYLEDDAPTREEFDNLQGRVEKLEHQPHSAA